MSKTWKSRSKYKPGRRRDLRPRESGVCDLSKQMRLSEIKQQQIAKARDRHTGLTVTGGNIPLPKRKPIA